MKLIYYSTAYFTSHGGSIHSKHFFEEANKHALVNSMLLFPEFKGTLITSSREGKVKKYIRNALRKSSLLQIFFFYRRNRFNLKTLIAFLERERPDAIIIRTDSNFLQIHHLRRMFPELIIGVEVNASPFDESFRNIAFRSYFQRLERQALSKAHFNFFVSAYLRHNIMLNECSENRDIIVHNGVDISVFFDRKNRQGIRQKLCLPQDRLILGYIGTLDSHKKIDNLLRAFANCVDQNPSLYLVIIGDGGDFQNLKALCANLGLQNNVKFTGWVKHETVPEYLNTFDIAIHHSANPYMSPLKIFEYLAVGLPVIGPDIAAVKEIFINGKHLVLTNGTIDDITEKILILVNDSLFAKDIAAAGNKILIENYTWYKQTDKILNTIHSKLLTKQSA
jgi:glycosyltransferase involved in cell wall biosynthesis